MAEHVSRVGARKAKVALAGVVTMVAVASAAMGGCSSSGDDDEPGDGPAVTTVPTLDRIDGPAVVDPSYDPFAVPDSGG